MQFLSQALATLLVALMSDGFAFAQEATPQQPLDTATVTAMPLLQATSCPADVPCGTDLYTETVTKYNDTTYLTRPVFSTTNHTIILTSTSLVVNVTTVIVQPVGVCETKTTTVVPTNRTIYIDETRTITQDLFATTTETRTTVHEYKSTLSLPCLQDITESTQKAPPSSAPPVVESPPRSPQSSQPSQSPSPVPTDAEDEDNENNENSEVD